MGSITSKMPLFVWDHLDDRYDFAQLAQNWQTVAFHDHTPGRGVPIPPGALAPGSVSTSAFDSSVIALLANQHLTVKIPPSGTYNANSGECVLTGATFPTTATVLLPSAVKDSFVTVIANTLVTSDNPVTITATGGSKIYGIGVSGGVTSITLGMVVAHVSLIADGSNWIIYAGQRDSGWVPITPNSGFSQNESRTAAIRLRADSYTMRGGIQNVSAGNGVSPATLPVGFRPTAGLLQLSNSYLIPTSGVLPTLGSGLVISFNGIIFAAD